MTKPSLSLALLFLLASPAAALEVILLGTGFPRPDPNRAGPSAAIVHGDRWFVVDAGRGATLRIAGTTLNYANLQGVFLTHLHSDHTAGLPDLFITSWQFGRKSVPLALYGPKGTKKLADGMLMFFEEDIRLRRDIQEKHPAAGARIRTREIGEGVILNERGLKITAFVVDHKPVEHALGYKFEAEGKSIVVSGDTRPNRNLIKFARGADVLVLEAYLPEHFDRVDTPAVAARLKSYHVSAEEAGAIAAESGVKTLVLTHLIPGKDEEIFRERASRKFKGRVEVGKDLMRVAP
jgi:ribonuclease Z